VLNEHVEFLERSLVEQELDALTRGQLAAGVLRLDALLAAAALCAGTTVFQGVQDILPVRPPVLSLTAIAGGSNTAFCGPGSGFRSRRAALPQRESARNFKVLPGRRA
jgi:hypothetical protein